MIRRKIEEMQLRLRPGLRLRKENGARYRGAFCEISCSEYIFELGGCPPLPGKKVPPYGKDMIFCIRR
jgi:hypothetical protein